MRSLNQKFVEIRDLFDDCGIENFEHLPEEQADKAMFAKHFQDLNKFLYASRLQGFTWDNLNPTMPDGSTIEVQIDEETYSILLQRYHELATGGGGGGDDDIQYDIDTQISELATGKINTDYMNANFTKYVRSLQANAPTEEQQKLLNSLHKSFATLSQEEQTYANVFLTDFMNGDIQLEEGKTFHDYIVEYQTRARDNRTQRFADALGLDAELLRDAMRNVFSESDITNALLKPIKDTMDLEKAKKYLEAQEGGLLSMRKVVTKVDDLLRKFILQGGFEIRDTIECEAPVIPMYSQFEEEEGTVMAAEPFECYKWNRFDQDIIDFFGGDKTILVGCYKGKKYLEWILSNHIYNVRLGKTKGSMEENKKLFGQTSLLVLYEHGKPHKLSAYRIISNKEMGKDELISLGYPNPKPRKSYMTFRISPLDMDLSFLVDQNLIERLIEINPDNEKGTPVFIEP